MLLGCEIWRTAQTLTKCDVYIASIDDVLILLLRGDGANYIEYLFIFDLQADIAKAIVKKHRTRKMTDPYL